jgi:hypothetical protein
MSSCEICGICYNNDYGYLKHIKNKRHQVRLYIKELLSKYIYIDNKEYITNYISEYKISKYEHENVLIKNKITIHTIDNPILKIEKWEIGQQNGTYVKICSNIQYIKLIDFLKQKKIYGLLEHIYELNELI